MFESFGEAEVAIVTAQEQKHPLDLISPCISPADVLYLRNCVKDVRVSAELKRYVVDIVAATRGAPSVQLGAGPRASLALIRVSQALALISGDQFVTPDHILEMAVPVIAHRLVLDPQAKFAGITAASVVESILKSVHVPA